MSALYSQMAARWWDSRTDEQRTAWLDRAEADGRERSMLAAYTLMGDLASEQDRESRDEGR